MLKLVAFRIGGSTNPGASPRQMGPKGAQADEDDAGNDGVERICPRSGSHKSTRTCKRREPSNILHVFVSREHRSMTAESIVFFFFSFLSNIHNINCERCVGLSVE